MSNQSVSEPIESIKMLHQAISQRQKADAQLTDALAKFAELRLANATRADEISAALGDFREDVLSW